MSRTAHKLMASGAKDKAYDIDGSLRFNYSGQSYLSRTASATGNRKTWTLSFWAKLSSQQNTYVFNAGQLSVAGLEAFMLSGGWQDIYFGQNYSPTYYRTSTVYDQGMDPSAWYHVFHVHDTTQSTAGNRSRTWINGVEFEEYTTELHSSFSYQDEDEQGLINTQALHRIGGADDNSQYMDGNLTEIHFIDGTVKAVGDFGKTDALTGQWVPKKYGGGGYGTNGFYLPFKKNDRYSVYFDGGTNAGIQTADHSDFSLGTNSFTIEAWVYVMSDGQYKYIGGQIDSTGANANASWQIAYGSDDKFYAYVFHTNTSGGYITLTASSTSTQKEWHHVALVRNGNSFVLYVDGVSKATETMSYAVPDQSSKIGVGVYGEYVDAGEFYGYISNFRFVNGTAVYTSNFTPSTSPLTAITNTKLLCCQDVTIATDNSGTSKTMTAIDSGSTYTQQMAPFNYDWYQDHSGQDNDWTPHNVTLFDISPDSPTNNFCTFNSQDAGPSNSTQGNLKWQSTDHADTCGTFKFPESGKWYYEIMMVDVNSGYAGIAPLRHTKVMGGAWDNDVLSIKLSTGQLYYYSSGNWGTHSYGSAFSDWDILQVAIDMDNNKFYFGKNGTWFNSGNPATGSNPAYTLTAAQKALGWKPLVYGPGSPNDLECIANFGQNATFCGSTTAGGNADGEGYGDFKYALPSGFKTLCSKNLPDPAIALPGDHFNTILYTGNGAQNHDISGVGFQPDFTWIKNRDQADSNVLHDAVRGVGKVIYSDLTLAENDNAAYFGPFQSDGFRLQPTTNGHAYNASSEKYVAHNWKANGAGSSNTDGTIDTTATSVNTTAGFAIGAYSGAGNAPKTVGHGLGKLPEVIMVKCRSHTVDWCVYHRHGTDETNSLTLNDTNILDDNDNRWHDTAPTSSVFTVGSSNEVNDSDKTYVYYAFAEIEGFSAFGTYLGTGETNGAFVHTGFRPMWIMLKNISGSVNNWYMFDSKRAPENVVDNALWANENWSDFTSASYNVNFLSNGFKLRTSTQNNASGAQYAYMAFAETPFKTANAR